MFRARTLSRYVALELLLVFLASLVVITGIFVILVVLDQAIDQDIALGMILHIVPLLIPSTLPYTVPTTALFAATVVYGRLGGDNEILAVKASGISPAVVMWPAWILSLVLGVACYLLLIDVIPRANRELRMGVTRDVEEYIYSKLERDRFLAPKQTRYSITVDEVRGRLLLGATFIRHSKDKGGLVETIVRARKARIRFDVEESKILVEAWNAEVNRLNEQTVHTAYHRTAVPFRFAEEANPKHKTNAEIDQYLANEYEGLARHRLGLVVTTAMDMAEGRWREMPLKYLAEVDFWAEESSKRIAKARTEREYRRAIAASPLFFTILGVPVAILFQRRDFLSAFGACFLPIIGIYYPLLIGMKRLAGEGAAPPSAVLWIGNVVLALLSVPFYRYVFKR